MEKRSFGLEMVEVRADGEDGPLISGYAAPFGHISADLGRFREVIAPGAFAESLAGDIRALWQHDTAQVLGRTKAGTLKIWEDERGLGFELIPADTQAGRDALVSLGRGDVDAMSFGFKVPKGGDRWENTEGGLLRTLYTVELREISPVTFPAYPETVAAVRSELDSAPEWVQRALTQGVDQDRTADGARARLRLRQRQRQLELLRLRGTR